MEIFWIINSYHENLKVLFYLKSLNYDISRVIEYREDSNGY